MREGRNELTDSRKLWETKGDGERGSRACRDKRGKEIR